MAEAKRQIELGHRVRDLISGFTGIATSRAESISGAVRWGIQPKMEEGKSEMPPSLYMDEPLLEYVDDGVRHIVRPAPPENFPVQLGHPCRDKASGLEGMAIGHSTYIAACTFYEFVPRNKQDGKELMPTQFVESWRLEPIKPTKDKPVVESRSKETGGPPTAVPRQSPPR